MKHVNHIIIFALATTGLLFSACKQSPNSISESYILKQFNSKLEEDAMKDQYIPLRTGVYECNDAGDRANLRSMAAAGLIEYHVDRYVWWEKAKKSTKKAYNVRRSNGWYTWTDTEYKWVKKDGYDFCDHYVVTIDLTNKGRRLVVKDRPEPASKDDPDLREPNIDESNYIWNKQDLTETWPEVPNPFIAHPEPKASEHPEQVGSSVQEKKTAPEPKDETIRIDSLQYQAFSKLTLSDETHCLKAFSVKAFKARNVRIGTKNGYPVAEAEVLVRTENVTDAGRIYNSIENDIRSCIDVTFTYYLDKGWVLNVFDYKR